MQFDGIFKVLFNSKRLNIEELKIPKVAKSQSNPILSSNKVFLEVLLYTSQFLMGFPSHLVALKATNRYNHWLTGLLHFDRLLSEVFVLQTGGFIPGCLSNSTGRFSHPEMVDQKWHGFNWSLRVIPWKGKPPKNTPTSWINCTWDAMFWFFRISWAPKAIPQRREKCSVHSFLKNHCLAILNCWVSGGFTCQFYGCI